MARSTVVAARRFVRRSSCPILPRDGFGAGVLETACWCRASVWASSLARWATARASATLGEGFVDRGDTMENPLFLVVGSQPSWPGRGRMSQARGRMSRVLGGRMSLCAFLHNKTPSACLPLHCLVVPNGREISLQRDDVRLGAGDGARTRDSLLGRQVVTRSPLASYEMAPRAAFALPHPM